MKFGDATRRRSRERAMRTRLLRRAYHYQDLARRHPEEERFWLCRATYCGRASWQRTNASQETLVQG